MIESSNSKGPDGRMNNLSLFHYSIVMCTADRVYSTVSNAGQLTAVLYSTVLGAA